MTICYYCGALLVFTAELKHRVATVEDVRNLPAEIALHISRVQQSIYRRKAARN